MGEQRFTIQNASGMYLHLPIFDNDVEMADGDVCILLNEQQATIEEQNKLIEKLRWDLNKTREDLNYFANLKVMAMKGCEPNE